VLLGVFLATIANFAITVTIGQLLTTVVPIDVISLAASISFIGFGLWTLRSEKPKHEDKKPSRFGVVGTVFVAFFIAEFGDKTQLTTISLAAQYQNAISVLVGATLGMLVADGLGIGVGVFLGKRVPEKTVKWISATVFLIFGLAGVYEVLSSKTGLVFTVLILVLLIVFSVSAIAFITQKERKTEKTSEAQNGNEAFSR
jgi:putative Ca2+/H+ antiporter (TMEM165/GDT1 family)